MAHASASSSAAMIFVALGYLWGTASLDDLERVVSSIVGPLYTCAVLVYITLRVYHLVIEPRLVNEKKQHPPKPAVAIDDSITKADQPVDLSGPFQLIENDNFENFLAAQGVPWALRSAANRCRPTHRFNHVGNSLKIKIEGIIETETTYQINGPKLQVFVRGRRFEDTVTYIESGVQTIKRAVDDGYSVQVHRILTADKQQIIMKSTVIFDDETKANVSCRQVFQRMEE